MSEEEIKTMVEKYFELVNNDSFDDFFALFAYDAQLSAPFGFKGNSVEEIKPFYQDIPNKYKEHTDTPERILIDGNRAAVFIDFKGVTKKGDAVAFKASDWFEFENGKIKSLNIFFDSFTFHRKVINPETK